MTATIYNKYLHKLYVCQHCQGKGKTIIEGTNIEADCYQCMGIGVKVFSLGTQIKDPFSARSIVSSYVQQNKKANIDLKFHPTVSKQKIQPPPYSPFRDPNNPLNPNNPNGWTHPFSPNNPFWRNNPANPNSLNNPNNPANPNRRFKK